MGKKAKPKKSRLRQRKAAPPVPPAKPDGRLVQPPPPSPYYRAISVLPEYVVEAAERLKQGTPSGQIIERQYLADEKPVLRFLETLNECGESAALTKLAGLLRTYPMILQHPYVWGIVRNLYAYWLMPNHVRQQWLHRIVKAWGEGVTFGSTVSIKRPISRQRGKRAALFPNLSERSGWELTPAADADWEAARQLVNLYCDLHERLRRQIQWKNYSRAFRKDPESVVDEITPTVQQDFEAFKQQWCLKGRVLPLDKAQEIVHTSFNELHKGRSPRHELTCQLLATIPWADGKGTPQKLSAEQIHKTLERLRKELGTEAFYLYRSDAQVAHGKRVPSSGYQDLP